MTEINHKLIGDTIVGSFRQCIYRGDAIDKNAPVLLKEILDKGYWRRPDKNKKPFTHVEQFIVALPEPGLGTDVATIKRTIAHDPEALDAFDRAMADTPRQGARTDIVSNRNEVGRPVGTTRQRAIRVLRDKRPDLHAKVMTGEMTPHRAMIAAGLRDETITIPLDPIKAAQRILGRFEGKRLDALIKALSEKPN